VRFIYIKTRENNCLQEIITNVVARISCVNFNIINNQEFSYCYYIRISILNGNLYNIKSSI